MKINKKQKPTISIIMPVYNAGEFLDKCLKSIQSQTFSDWELVVVDDGSTDNSYTMLLRAAKKDKRIHVYRNAKNSGVATTLNHAIKKAQGKYLARMDADDLMIKNRLDLQKKYLDTHSETVVVGGQCQLINIKGKVIGQKNYPIRNREIRKMIFTFSPTSHPSIMINRKLVPKEFKWYNQTACPAEDIDLYFRLFRYGKFANLEKSVIKYRLYPTSTSFKDPKQNFFRTQNVRNAAIKKHGYKPGRRARIMNVLEASAIKILPNSLIYPMYLVMRGLVEINLNLNINPTKLTRFLVFDFDFIPQRRIN